MPPYPKQPPLAPPQGDSRRDALPAMPALPPLTREQREAMQANVRRLRELRECEKAADDKKPSDGA